jgi:hypothetical protein
MLLLLAYVRALCRVHTAISWHQQLLLLLLSLGFTQLLMLLLMLHLLLLCYWQSCS